MLQHLPSNIDRDVRPNKRQRVEYVMEDGSVEPGWLMTISPALDSQSRCVLQRSIAAVLRHAGFETAAPDALEGFTAVVETCESAVCSTRAAPTSLFILSLYPF